jgi:hypothetical protein
MISRRRPGQAACLIALTGSYTTRDVSPFQGDPPAVNNDLQRIQHAHSEGSSTGLRAGTQAVVGAHALPLSVDGAKNPELVPDPLAYRHFFLSTIPPDNAPAESTSKRQELRLTKLGLEGQDREDYVRAMGQARESLASIAVQRASWSDPPLDTATSRVMLKRLAEQEAQVFEDTRRLLQYSLTTEGFGRLEAYVRGSVKQKIRIYGSTTR